MIKFHCSGCQKAIGVDPQFAGRLIKCPSCEGATRVPASVAEPATKEPVVEATLAWDSSPSESNSAAAGVPVAAIAKDANSLDTTSYYDPGANTKNRSGPSTGAAWGGWFAGVGIGMFLAILWGVIATLAIGPAGQVLAWAIGAVVGCVAGLIARNRSILFCTSTMFGGLLCILFGKLIAALVAMIAVNSISMVQGIGASFTPDSGVSVGLMEQMALEGEFEGDNKKYADMKVKSYFSNTEVYESEGYADLNDSCEIEVDMQVQRRLSDLTPEEKTALREQVRIDHPEWIENDYHFDAVLDLLVANKEIENEVLLGEAQAELKTLPQRSSDNFFGVMPDRNLSPELKTLVGEKYANTSEQQLDDAVRECMRRHPGWIPKRVEFLVVLQQELDAGTIPEPLVQTAKSITDVELRGIYDADSFENFDEESIEADNANAMQLQKIVSEKIVDTSQEQIDMMVATAQKQYPTLAAMNQEIDLMDDFTGQLDEAVDWFGTDGTFSNAFATRFSILDSLWITLGLISAFAIAFALGRPRTEV